MTPKQRLIHIYRQLEQLSGEKPYVARGFAIGVFISMTPTIPLNTILAVILGFLLRGSIPAAFIGTLISNPVTIPFLYYAAYWLGVTVTRVQGVSFDEILTLAYHFNGPGTLQEKIHEAGHLIHGKVPVLWASLLGGVIMGIPVAIGTYYLTLRLLRASASERLLPSEDNPKNDSTPDPP
ncbi:hypothetical protein LZ24_02854 [Desulfobotulus alkaliphilus]|uniref:DUF2062 domain-containing protein n=1 Tax=Desulfobotulus alkaliphilus TaxID=622671 RepID=A0A562RCX8_9BACT|nr:DUF2062 domain-containing protein [Desulfobotulus alkaliphilus]TWI66897.1 hypothetical protein LZ24_02854 [Desulfobotulus alkaliphilus]